MHQKCNSTTVKSTELQTDEPICSDVAGICFENFLDVPYLLWKTLDDIAKVNALRDLLTSGLHTSQG